MLRNNVAVMLNLFDAPAGFSYVGGIGSKPEERQLYGALMHLAGQTVTVAVDYRDDFNENLLGRDVINEFKLTICPKRELVSFECVPDSQI